MADEAGVAAVDRALSILDAFTHADPELSLAQIAKRTGLYKSTVLRLTKSLERFGYIHRSADGAYCLGSKVLFLGSLYQRHFRTSAIVPQVLGRIVDELKESASFFVQDGDYRICPGQVDSSRGTRCKATVATVGASVMSSSSLERPALIRKVRMTCTRRAENATRNRCGIVSRFPRRRATAGALAVSVRGTAQRRPARCRCSSSTPST
jgi:hypothetical protein